MRKVREVMKTGVVSVKEDMTVAELMEFFDKKGFSGAPVVDADNKLIGLVSKTDIALRRLESGSLKDLPVGELMTPFLFDISPDHSLLSVIETMDRAGIHRIVVTDNGQPVGIVTTMDLIRDYAKVLA